MSIILKPEQEQFIHEKLKSGKYQNADEVIAIAFRLLEAQEKDYEQWVEETRKKVNVGLAELEHGEGLDGEVVIEQLREKFRRARE